MTLENLKRANSIKQTIDKLDCEKSRVSKYFSNKDNLTEDDIEGLIKIAIINTDYTLKTLKKELSDL